MIEITIYTRDGRYIGIRSSGHAGYEDSGKDIVCAGVSVLLINLVNSIESFTKADLSVENDDGYLCIKLSEPIEDKSGLLLDSCILGLMDIAEEYGEDFVNIKLQEVK